MQMARIFAPIRHPAASTEAGAVLPQSPAPDEDGGRDSRVGMQPVTNTSPPGDIVAPQAALEETWMAMLELVFAETGWPDA